MDKYKVLLVHNYYKIPGGEDVVFANEKRMLEENGHEVVTYTRRNDEIKNKIGFLGKIGLFFETIYSKKTYKVVRNLIKKENIDIVHVHNTLPLISPSVYYAAFKENTPVVQTIHNFRLLCPGATFTRDGHICEECLKCGLRQSLKYKCYRNSFAQTFTVVCMLWFHRLIGTYKKVDGYIALTDFNKNKLSNLIKDDNKIFVKPNFVKQNNLIETNEKRENYFVYLGRIEKIKGVSFLVKAWRKIKDSELYIIGDGPDKDDIEKYIHDNDIENVKMLGFMKREDAFKILKRSKALIVPSQGYEGLPMTIVESLSLGTPVIGGRIGNVEVSIKDNYNGLLFKYNDPNDLKDKVELLSSNEYIQNKLSEGAIKTYESYYNDKVNYKMLYKIYSKVMRDKHGKM